MIFQISSHKASSSADRGKLGATHSESTTSSETASAGLDLEAVVKAAQAISGEMVLEQLLQKLMRIVIENAAAQTGYLLLQKNGELVIEATGGVQR